MTLDRGLGYHVHTTNIKNKASAAIKRLNPLLRNHSALSVDNGLIIYKMLIRPIITYASTVWGGTAKTNLNKVQTAQNRVLKLITDAPRYTKISRLHEELNVEYIKDYIIKAGKDFYQKSKKSKHDLIKNLGDYDYDPRDKYRRPKDFLDIIK